MQQFCLVRGITPYSSFKINRRFGGTCCLSLGSKKKPKKNPSWIVRWTWSACHLLQADVFINLFFDLKMEYTCSSETSVDLQRTTCRVVPEEGIVHYRRDDSPRFCVVIRADFETRHSREADSCSVGYEIHIPLCRTSLIVAFSGASNGPYPESDASSPQLWTTFSYCFSAVFLFTSRSIRWPSSFKFYERYTVCISIYTSSIFL
jgi:hypothetical protein